jgi:hypothetical protein
MHNKLKIYYLLTPLPFVMLIIGAIFFRQAIANTLVNNPHPQINYAIFALILIGAGFILINLFKLMKEAAALGEFTDAIREGTEPAKLQAKALTYDADVGYVLRLIAASSGRTMTHREQGALEKELVKADIRLSNRHTLPQHITNLLVGMGLLGTFVGLLATLGDIAALISSFATIDMSTANPVEVFRVLVERMKAPMYSMGIAFSASLYGLLGSIILGFMMVSIRRCMQDVVSLLGSEVAQHVEFALARELLEKSSKAPQEGGGFASGSAASGTGAVVSLDADVSPDAVRALRRIEERLAESTRLQEEGLRNDREEFSRQRGEFMRTVAEHGASVSQFSVELQRVGIQLGALLNGLERGNGELRAHLHDYFSSLIASAHQQSRASGVAGDLMVRMADDSAESRRLMGLLLDRAAQSGDPQANNAELAKMLTIALQQALQGSVVEKEKPRAV